MIDAEFVGHIVLLRLGIREGTCQRHLDPGEMPAHGTEHEFLLKLEEVGVESGTLALVALDRDRQIPQRSRVAFLRQLEE